MLNFMITSAWSCRKVSVLSTAIWLRRTPIWPSGVVERVGVQGGRVDLRLGDANIAMVMRVAGLVAEGDVAVDVVLELDRAHVHVGLQIIAMLKAVIVAALDRSGAIEQPGDAVVGRVVGAFMQIAECEAGRRAQSESQRGSDAIAPALGDIPSRELRVVPHQVQPESRATSECRSAADPDRR